MNFVSTISGKCSPCFDLSSNTDHENLEHDKLILPFIEKLIPGDTIIGGSCEVQKVKIHIAHQRYHLADVSSSERYLQVIPTLTNIFLEAGRC
jgi:hypothetical protein